MQSDIEGLYEENVKLKKPTTIQYLTELKTQETEGTKCHTRYHIVHCECVI